MTGTGRTRAGRAGALVEGTGAVVEGTVRARAAGKINISLRVGSAGADGYHPLATVFQAVSLFEDVIAVPDDEISVSVSGRHAELVPTDGRNLAVRAARLLADATGVTDGVRLHIVKRVPTAGGMGGGSADAAAALLACDHLWGTGLDRTELGHLAAELGADVPFALTGQTAIGLGRGDLLSPALARGRFWWVLALQETGISTPAAFALWDDQHRQHVPAPEVDPDLMKALVAGDPAALAPHLQCDLAPAALTQRPELADVLATVAATPALGAVVSGSGPTIAALAADGAAAEAVALAVREAGVADEVLVVHGPAPGARLLESVATTTAVPDPED